MFRKAVTITFIYFLFSLPENKIICQTIDSASFRINTRSSFYSYEDSGEILLYIPQNLMYIKTDVSLTLEDQPLASWKGVPAKKIIRIPFRLDMIHSSCQVIARISVTGRSTIYITSAELTVLEYKTNEVKTDRLTGGLIVGRKPFFPFGFYCYSPVYPTLPEEEVVRGFNLISPYQRILPQTIGERKVYMDRCAELGMKVHYNLLSVTGGGGVGSGIQLTDEEKETLLINEILTFRDHPALLAWYISDEPTGHKVSPEFLEKIYNTVKKKDPWHPVSIVFMAPFMSSVRYEKAMDIVMADPYPVPVMQAAMVGDVTSQLSGAFNGKKPVWIVPQAFGGGEWWEREPTLQEVRSMTYQAIIRGARGIQFFIRQGLNLFPKSTAAWGECGRMAVETAELTPWLLSDEEAPKVRSASPNIIATSAVHDNILMIMAANRVNSPQNAEFFVAGIPAGKARVIFENRTITVNNGFLTDNLSAFGTQVYMINLKPVKETKKPYPGNLLTDPGFENTASPGVPASCYARGGGDRGATYFTDTREHFEGNHSIRLVTPVENKGIRLRFYPVSVMNGKTYLISVMAKAENKGNKIQNFEISLGDYGSARFAMTDQWQEFITNVTIPYYNDLPPRTNVILQMPSTGIAWFDLLQIIECVDINRSINPELKYEWDL